MADKLIAVNQYVSVKASLVRCVAAHRNGEVVHVCLTDGSSEELEIPCGQNFWDAKRNFEQAVNDALKGQ